MERLHRNGKSVQAATAMAAATAAAEKGQQRAACHQQPPAQLYDPNSVRPQKMLLYIIYDDLFKGVPGGRNVRNSVSPIAIRGLASLIACMYIRTDALAKMLFYLIYGEAI